MCDQDPGFTSSLMEAFTEQLTIKMIMVSPTNHKSLLAEYGIKMIKYVFGTCLWYLVAILSVDGHR